MKSFPNKDPRTHCLCDVTRSFPVCSLSQVTILRAPCVSLFSWMLKISLLYLSNKGSVLPFLARHARRTSNGLDLAHFIDTALRECAQLLPQFPAALLFNLQYNTVPVTHPYNRGGKVETACTLVTVLHDLLHKLIIASKL